MRSITWLILAMILSSSLYAGTAADKTSELPDQRSITIRFVKTGIHTDLVLPRRYLQHWVSNHDAVFGDAEHVAVGWGESRYFSARNKSVLKMVPALLLPTRSAIRLRPFDPLSDSNDVMIPFNVNTDDLERLLAFIDRSILDDSETRRKMILREDAIFYPARLRYSLVRTCNNWSARALRKAGLKIGHRRAMLAGNVTRQLRVRLSQQDTIPSF